MEIYPQVQSGQCDERMSEMFTRLKPHLKNPTARHLHERAREVVPVKQPA
ncbi:hypothetical protein [Streptomyces sp. C36]